MEISTDGEHWTTAFEQAIAPMTKEQDHGVYAHAYEFAPAEGRWVRVSVQSERCIPSWHAYAAGGAGFLFVDELSLR